MEMSADTSLASLNARLARLRDALEALGTTVDEDRPRSGEVAAVAYFADAVLAVRGAMEEAQAALGRPEQACELRVSLANCHRQFHAYSRRFAADLAGRERLDDLARVAKVGRGWGDWVGVVRQELDQCALLADEVDDALLDCWQDLVERAAAVAIHNTVIGSQIAFPAAGGRDRVVTPS
jgi:hypothetical protein